jgi:UDP-N-acetylmuramate: L-alanyl-gamma-D-glutamyl-meso-diaminopimelate ligase
MNVHFIAIGGSAMHSLAIALHHKGYRITGSDDEIFEPSRSRLASLGLLPKKEGWDPGSITPDLDAVILGMHAKSDNPELIRAKETGVKIYSYPEYLYEHSKDKIRIVIAGSHGKTTITAMILHVLKESSVECDFLIGAKLEGFNIMVRLTDTSPIMIFEGDEYLTSPIDPRPKFHLYRPHIALLSGIAWDHINVFPTFNCYLDQFREFIRRIEPAGSLTYCEADPILKEISLHTRNDLKIYPYALSDYEILNGITSIIHNGIRYPLHIFGRHNLTNLQGARMICQQIGISDECFFKSITGFKGASMRMEKLYQDHSLTVYRDFAHAPSKVKATINALNEQYPDQTLVACFELHTFSSLNDLFLPHYAGTMDEADKAIVYFDPHAIKLKRLPEISPAQVKAGFGHPNLEVYSDSKLLKERLRLRPEGKSVLLLMSSGDFGGMAVSGF